MRSGCVAVWYLDKDVAMMLASVFSGGLWAALVTFFLLFGALFAAALGIAAAGGA